MSPDSVIAYVIQPKHPGTHLFAVECTIDKPDPDRQKLSLPAWIPGSYLIRDYARHIIEISALAGDSELELVKIDKSTWQCAPCDGPITIRYEVYANDLSVRGAHLDTTHAYFNGPCVFLKVHGQEESPCTVDIRIPEDPAMRGWRVATALVPVDENPYEFGLYRAANYAELIDCPVEMGAFDLVEFTAGGQPHAMAITGLHRADMERIAADLAQLCEYHIEFFGRPAPMDRYIFLLTTVSSGYGGLEHRSSSSLMCRRDYLPLPGQQKLRTGYQKFLGLVSHEYFHSWNVKRIQPEVFNKANLQHEVHTRLMWVFEGLTSYYDDLALLRSGLIPVSAYLSALGETLTAVWQSPGRFRQTLEESSFDAWTKLYKRDENAPNAIISYYTKGAAAGLALDLTIRRDTDDRLSLDDVMREIWARYGRTGMGMPEDGFEKTCADVTGLDLREFFEHALRSTDDLPLAELLEDVGVTFHLRPATSDQDKGGTPGKEADKLRPTLDVVTAKKGDGVVLSNVLTGGAGQKAGLSAGDELVAIDGVRVSPGNLKTVLAMYSIGDEAEISLFRRDELKHFNVTLDAPRADTCFITLNEEAHGKTLARRNRWLGQDV